MKKNLKKIKLSDNLKKVYGFCGGGSSGGGCGSSQYGFNTGYSYYAGSLDGYKSCMFSSSHIQGHDCNGGSYISTGCGPGYSTSSY